MRFIAFRLQIVLDLHCLACDFAQHFSIFKYLLCAGRGTHRASHAPRREKAAGLSQESAAAVARAKQVLASPLVHCARKPANTNDRKQPRVGYTVSRTAGACECGIGAGARQSDQAPAFLGAEPHRRVQRQRLLTASLGASVCSLASPMRSTAQHEETDSSWVHGESMGNL
eukprot:1195417-Rhodomonas_salina.3